MACDVGTGSFRASSGTSEARVARRRLAAAIRLFGPIPCMKHVLGRKCGGFVRVTSWVC